MRKLILVTILALSPFIVGWTANWTLPTEYTDNTAIPTAKIPTIQVKLYFDNVPYTTTVAGAISYSGAGHYGQRLSVSSVLDGVEGAQSPSVTIPLAGPKSPGALSVSP